MTYTIKCVLFLALAASFTFALFGGFAAAGLVWLIERVLG